MEGGALGWDAAQRRALQAIRLTQSYDGHAAEVCGWRRVAMMCLPPKDGRPAQMVGCG
jgi:hypothetical protein